MTATIVDALGTIAGCVWLSVAVYYQLVFDGDVHPGYIVGCLLVGAGLVMVSSAATLASARIVFALGVFANAMFLVLGVVAFFRIREQAQREALTGTDEHTHS